MRAIDADELKKKAFGKRGGLIHTADIDAMPTIELERKTGKWVRETKHYKDSEQEFYYYEERCSECGTKRKKGWEEVKYCPMCGAILVQEGEDNGQND